MKRIFYCTLLLPMSIGLNLSYGKEGAGGHGGFVYLCGERTELIDLEEKNFIIGLRDKMFIVESPEDEFVQARNVLKKIENIDSEVYKTAVTKLDKIQAQFPNLTTSTEWIVPMDLGPVARKAGCKIENVVNYLNEYHIELNRNFYNSFASKTHQAALWVHEVLFSMARDEDRSEQENSLAVRRIVAYLFSNLKKPELLYGLVKGYLSLKSHVGTVIILTSKFVTAAKIKHHIKTEDNNHAPFYRPYIFVDGIDKTPMRARKRRLEYLPWSEFEINVDSKTLMIEIKTIAFGVSGSYVRAKTNTLISYDSDERSFENSMNGETGETNTNSFSITKKYTFIPGFVMDYIYGEL